MLPFAGGFAVVVTFTLTDSEFGVVLVDDGIAGTPDDETHIRDPRWGSGRATRRRRNPSAGGDPVA